MSTSATRIRAGAFALAAAGLLFLAYPVLRPWHDEGTVAGATASMSSSAWVTALPQSASPTASCSPQA